MYILLIYLIMIYIIVNVIYVNKALVLIKIKGCINIIVTAKAL